MRSLERAELDSLAADGRRVVRAGNCDGREAVHAANADGYRECRYGLNAAARTRRGTCVRPDRRTDRGSCVGNRYLSE